MPAVIPLPKYIQDPGIIAVRDNGNGNGNGTGQGITGVEILGGNLQCRPLDQKSIMTTDSVNGTASFQKGLPYTSDGTGLGVNCAVPNVAGNYLKIWVPFYGRTFGVKFVNANFVGFSVSVDAAEFKRVEHPEGYLVAEQRTGPYSHDMLKITHEDLGPGLHVAQLMFSPGQQALLSGIIVDKTFDYGAPLLRAAVLGTQKMVGIGQANVSTLNLSAVSPLISTSYSFDWITKIVYTNYSMSANVLYQTNNSFTVSTIAIGPPAAITLTANHGFADGQPVAISGTTGTTGVNIVGFAKATGFAANIFGLYADAALSTPITGVGGGASGGTVLQIDKSYPMVAAASNGVPGQCLEIPFIQPSVSSAINHFALGAGVTVQTHGGFNG